MIFSLLVLVGITIPASAADEKPDPAAAREFEALAKEFDAAQEAFQAEFNKATTQEQRQKLFAEKAPRADKIAPKFMALVEKYPKDPIALDALMWVIANGEGSLHQKDSPASKSLTMLEKLFVASPDLGRAIGILEDKPSMSAEKFLRVVIEKNEKKGIKGRAWLALAKGLRERSNMVRELKGNANVAKFVEQEEGKEFVAAWMKLDPAEILKESEKAFDQVVKDYADVEVSVGPRTYKIGKLAEANLFEMRNLAIGKSVPDETLESIDGKKIKLAELRGKVVVLNFWATWCEPCREMIPSEKKLVEKLKDSPFAFIGISVDDEKKAIEAFIKKMEMPWAQVHNGPEGGIADKWNVQYFPTIYVIDAKGVIRFKDLRGKDLDEAVEKLLKEEK